MTISTADGVSLTDDVSEDSVKTALNATGLAPIYAIRAFGSTSAAVVTTVSGTYSRSGTTVTVDFGVGVHGKTAGERFYFNATTGTATDGVFTVLSVTDTHIFTFTHSASGAASGDCVQSTLPVLAGGNIAEIYYSSAGALFWVFQTAMPHANYAISPNSSLATVINNAGATQTVDYFSHTMQTYTGTSFDPSFISMMVTC